MGVRVPSATTVVGRCWSGHRCVLFMVLSTIAATTTSTPIASADTTTATTTQTRQTWTTTTTTTDIELGRATCADQVRNCGRCFAIGCRFCEVGPYYTMRGGAAAIAAQGDKLDYVCSADPCVDLKGLRPGTGYTRTVPWNACDSVKLATTLTTTLTTTTLTTVTTQLLAIDTDGAEGPEWWPDWQGYQWFAILFPPLTLIAISCGIWIRWRRRHGKCRCTRKKSRVHVAPLAKASPGGADVAFWDFASAGSLSPDDIKNADDALVEANEDASRAKARGKALQPPPNPCLVFCVENKLKQTHLKLMSELLERHSKASVSLHTDWRGSNDATLMALAAILKLKGRCRLQTVAGDELSPLRLSPSASAGVLALVAEAIGAGAHAEIDAITLEMPESLIGTRAEEPRNTLGLSPLRCSCQDLSVSKQPLGDLGCAAACGFVTSWASRLLSIRIIDCEIGDDGATAIAALINGRNLLTGGSVGGGTECLRELNLSSNRISDAGTKAIADVLPRCDSLERLLLDRNRIGRAGAKSLAARLPRSNVKELVLGSHLGGNPLGPEGAEALASSLDDEMARAAADRATRLRALNLEECNIGERGARSIAANMPKSHLMVLSVARGNIGDGGADALLQALPPCIASLDLAGNSLGDITASKVGDTFYKYPQLAVSLAQNNVSPMLRSVLYEEHGARLRV